MRIRARTLRRTSATRLFLTLCGSIFAGEALVMFWLAQLRSLSPWGGALLDAALLQVAVFPILYFLSFRPLATDIAQREQAEEALRGIEAQLKVTLDSTVDGILAVDNEGKTLHTNRQFADLWRIPQSLIERGDDKAMLEFVLDQLVEPSAFLSEVQSLYGSDAVDADTLHFKDGRVFERYSVPMLVEGARVGRLWSFRDVTERKRAEEALLYSRAILQSVADGTTDAVFVKDDRGRYLMCNDAACGFVGKSREEILGNDDTALFPPNEAREVMERDRRVMESRVTQTFDEPVMANGVPTTFQATKGPVLDETGRVIGLFGVSRDITAHRWAEEALRESEEKYRSLFNNAEVGMFRTRLDGSAMLAMNDQFLRIFELTREEAKGSPSVIRWADPQRRLEMVRRLEAEGRVTDFECGMLTKTGEVRQCVMSVRLYPAEAILEGSIADVTDRKRAEEERARLEAQLQHAQKMESVGRLAGGVAHDFNNQLSVILGHTELALAQTDPVQPLHDDLSEIHKAAARSADLTRQLLAYARKQQIVPRVLNINDTVARSAKMLQRLIGEDITLSCRPTEPIWPVFMDPSQLDQILANLCANARDAIADVGSMAIATSNCIVDLPFCDAHEDANPGEYVRLTASDSGHGMGGDILPHIFEPFFTTKAVGKGTGLGLSTVYGIVRQNNGFITVHSTPDQGTTFDIYLPRWLGEVESAKPSGAAAPAAPGLETVLLVEDEPALLRMATRTLERQGYTVLRASGPGEAIRLADEHAGEIDLLLTDVVMPEMNGRDLVDTLLSKRPRLRYLFMSGFAARESDGHDSLMDAAHFIAKPFALTEFTAKVREVLDRG